MATRKTYQFHPDLLYLDNEMERFVRHEWPRQRNRTGSRVKETASFLMVLFVVACIAVAIVQVTQ